MRLKRALLPASLAAGLLTACAALADDFGLSEAAPPGLPTGLSVPDFIARLIAVALTFVATLFLILIIYAGFLWMTARGDEKKVTSAKQMITGAVIGLVIIAGAYALTSFILNAVISSQQTQATPPAPNSVPIGGACTDSNQCTPAGSTICGTDGKCTSVIEGQP